MSPNDPTPASSEAAVESGGQSEAAPGARLAPASENARPTPFDVAELRREFGGFIWDHLGATISVTFERAGVEVTFVGRVAADMDGSFSIDENRLWLATAGIPIRWAAHETGAPQ